MTMFISDSYQQAGGTGQSFSSNSYTLGNDFTIHALQRDDDGMLNYTRIRSIDDEIGDFYRFCLLYTSPSPRDLSTSRMPSSA